MTPEEARRILEKAIKELSENKNTIAEIIFQDMKEKGEIPSGISDEKAKQIIREFLDEQEQKS